MALFNTGFGLDSDILSAALVESELNLSEPQPLSTDRNENGIAAGGSLSLESTSTPAELVKWANYLSNHDSQSLTGFLTSFKSDELPNTNHDRDVKTNSTTFSSLLDENSLPEINLSDNNLFLPAVKKEPTDIKNFLTLADLLSSDNGSPFRSIVNNTANTSINGFAGNSADLQVPKK